MSIYSQEVLDDFFEQVTDEELFAWQKQSLERLSQSMGTLEPEFVEPDMVQFKDTNGISYNLYKSKDKAHDHAFQDVLNLIELDPDSYADVLRSYPNLFYIPEGGVEMLANESASFVYKYSLKELLEDPAYDLKSSEAYKDYIAEKAKKPELVKQKNQIKQRLVTAPSEVEKEYFKQQLDLVLSEMSVLDDEIERLEDGVKKKAFLQEKELIEEMIVKEPIKYIETYLGFQSAMDSSWIEFDKIEAAQNILKQYGIDRILGGAGKMVGSKYLLELA